MQHYPKVTIGVVLHKVNPHLKECLTSLTEQDYPNIEYILRDQSPNGEAYDFIEKKLPDVFDVVHIEKGENLFHSGGHNAIIRQMTGEYYICASNDMLYPPNFVYSMVIEMEKHENKKYGSATCKLMSWDFVLRNNDYPEIDKTTIIDSCGIGIRSNHFFYDIGQGDEDRNQYDHKRDIFGASGALAMYRKKALEDISCSLKVRLANRTASPKVRLANYATSPKVRLANRTNKYIKEYFDELLHYKNDVDLAYRLQWAGWPCLFMPEVKVYHDRLAGNPSQSGFMVTRLIRARKNKPKWIKENSFFGQQVVMIKDYSKKFSLSVRISTALQEFGTFLFALILEPYLLKQLKAVKKHEKEILAKRDLMKRVVTPEEIEKFMT